MIEVVNQEAFDAAVALVAKARCCSPEVLGWCSGFMTCSSDLCLEVKARYSEILAKREAAKPAPRGPLPADNKARLDYPMAEGLLYYFPAALAEVARVSKIGNDQHNPGEPLHWARTKSTDHENKILRHLTESGTKDGEGVRHSARLAWRALALLQVELEREEGAPPPRNARF